ncbi:HET-domain-containing protein [Glonium stellatum]|uniref:HET-domain-containing protein n=1 Tax=Glonium stellatum TaxID=574774 RepID=A0A8E2JPT9_9PEZI|nr:HET-domain-containing protein [Glonium stellatum]
MGSPTTAAPLDGTQLGIEHGLPQYPGQPLQGTDAFRLVTILPGKEESSICCRLFNVRLQDAPKYEAVSYTWGDQSDRSTIVFDEPSIEQAGRLSVTTNSVLALRRFRHIDKPRTIWIDQICVNQADTHERNRQILLMTRIYRQAEGVVIYLGESRDNSDLAMDIISDIHTPSNDSEGRVLKPDMDMLQHFFDRPWFNRIWVLQEVAMARSAVVNCGRKSLSWDAFRTFSSWNAVNRWLRELPYIMVQEREKEQMAKYHSEDGLLKKYLEEDLVKKLIKTRGCAASDPRDKVYAVLPLVSQSESRVEVVPDYGLSPAAVFTDVAEKLLTIVGVEILCQVQEHSELPGLPSWVPDWSAIRRTEILGFGRKNSFTPPFQAGGLYTPDQPPATKTWHTERIYLDAVQLKAQGIQLGRISVLGDRCDLSINYFPIRQWNDIALRAHTSGEEFEAADGSRRAWNNVTFKATLTTFERTLTMENIVYPNAVRRGMEILSQDSEAGNRIDALLKWGKLPTLPPSYARQVIWMLEACNQRRFFLTERGQMGLAPSEAKSEDIVCILLGASVPFILRPKENAFRLIGQCYVQGAMKGEALKRFNKTTSDEKVSCVPLEEFTIW